MSGGQSEINRQVDQFLAVNVAVRALAEALEDCYDPVFDVIPENIKLEVLFHLEKFGVVFQENKK